MDYKSVFTNLCLELQQNRSWIKGLGKNPQKSELIHWRQCLLSGGTEACSLGFRETPACIHVIQHWHVDTASGKTQKTECVFTCYPTGGRSEGIKRQFIKSCQAAIHFSGLFTVYCLFHHIHVGAAHMVLILWIHCHSKKSIQTDVGNWMGFRITRCVEKVTLPVKMAADGSKHLSK